jgi:hypothetical protein
MNIRCAATNDYKKNQKTRRYIKKKSSPVRIR